MLFTALLAVWLGVPFEDTEHRFSIDLPGQWAFAPLPGDMGGAAFRRVSDGILANAMVRVLRFDRDIELNSIVAQIRNTYEAEPGFRLLISEPVQVAKNPGHRLRFVTWINGNPKMPKICEQRIMLLGRMAYVIHVETLADAYGVFEPDFDALFRSFIPGNGLAAPPVTQMYSPINPKILHGKWVTAGNTHKLELSPSGIVILDGKRGRYRLDHGTLVIRYADDENNSEVMYEMDFHHNQLALTGSDFQKTQKFYRVTASGHKKEKPPAKAVSTDL